MTKYEVLLSHTAVSQLNLLNKRQKNRVKRALRLLEDDPFRKRPRADIKRLLTTGDPPLFRLRIGDYRAIYFIVGTQVRITEIIHRSKGYNWLD